MATITWSLGSLADRYAAVRGLRVRYWEAGAGSPVLLLHGLGGSVETWLPNVAPLAERHRVLALDLPGFGRSDRPAERATPRFAAEFVAAFLDEVGAGPAAVAGNSLGGFVALCLALDHPERVSRLVLANSAGLGREVGASLRLAAVPVLGRYLASRMTPEEAVLGTLAACCANAADLPRDYVDRLIELAKLPGATDMVLETARTGIDLFGQRRSIVLRRRLPELRCPTLIVWGDRDPVIPVAHGYAAHRLIPGSELRVFAGSRHCPQLERPAEFNELVLGFLERGEPPSPQVGPVAGSPTVTAQSRGLAT